MHPRTGRRRPRGGVKASLRLAPCGAAALVAPAAPGRFYRGAPGSSRSLRNAAQRSASASASHWPGGGGSSAMAAPAPGGEPNRRPMGRGTDDGELAGPLGPGGGSEGSAPSSASAPGRGSSRPPRAGRPSAPLSRAGSPRPCRRLPAPRPDGGDDPRGPAPAPPRRRCWRW